MTKLALLASGLLAVAACAQGVGESSTCSGACEGGAEGGLESDATMASDGASEGGQGLFDAGGTPESGPQAEASDYDTSTPEGSVEDSHAEDARDSDAHDADAAKEDSAPHDASTDAEHDDAKPHDAEAEVSTDAPVDAPPPPDTGTDSGCGTVYLTEPFSGTTNGWTVDGAWAIASTCASPPAPEKGNPDPTKDHTTGGSGGVLAAYPCGNNPKDTEIAAQYATSPALDTSGAKTLKVSFYRWLNTDDAKYLASTFDVYDGTKWVNLYTNAASSLTTDSSWTREEYDVSAYAGATFQVRFGYALLSNSVYAMSDWNVDDLVVSTSTCN